MNLYTDKNSVAFVCTVVSLQLAAAAGRILCEYNGSDLCICDSRRCTVDLRVSNSSIMR